jgi:hypothetical protein
MSKMLWMTLVMAVAAAAAGCDDTDPAWQLENDRIIAVRSTPPALGAGERATLDVLVTSAGRGPFVVSPLGAIAVPDDPAGQVPDVLSRAVAPQGPAWTVVAPDVAALATLRTSLGLAADAPVPLRVGIRVDLGSGPLDAVKTVNLGGPPVANPSLGAVTIAGAAAKDGMVIDPDVDVALRVEAGADDKVFWLTSIGDLTDESDLVATLRHDSKKKATLSSGHIAVVVRTPEGGVAWGFWQASIRP